MRSLTATCSTSSSAPQPRTSQVSTSTFSNVSITAVANYSSVFNSITLGEKEPLFTRMVEVSPQYIVVNLSKQDILFTQANIQLDI